jgi:hypothetical protein
MPISDQEQMRRIYRIPPYYYYPQPPRPNAIRVLAPIFVMNNQRHWMSFIEDIPDDTTTQSETATTNTRSKPNDRLAYGTSNDDAIPIIGSEGRIMYWIR